MTELFQVFERTSSPILLLLVVGMLTISFGREYFRVLIRLRKLRYEWQVRQEEDERHDPENGNESPVDHIADFEEARAHGRAVHDDQDTQPSTSLVVNSTFRMLEKYYEQHLTEYKLMARASLTIAAIGFLIIVIGILFVFSDLVSVGVIASVGGVVAEGAAVLFFRQNSALINEVREYHKKLVSTQYILTSISLASRLPQNDSVRENKRIIINLLHLSNELHGASSDHLFDSDASKDLAPNNEDESALFQ